MIPLRTMGAQLAASRRPLGWPMNRTWLPGCSDLDARGVFSGVLKRPTCSSSGSRMTAMSILGRHGLSTDCRLQWIELRRMHVAADIHAGETNPISLGDKVPVGHQVRADLAVVDAKIPLPKLPRHVTDERCASPRTRTVPAFQQDHTPLCVGQPLRRITQGALTVASRSPWRDDGRRRGECSRAGPAPRCLAPPRTCCPRAPQGHGGRRSPDWWLLARRDKTGPGPSPGPVGGDVGATRRRPRDGSALARRVLRGAGASASGASSGASMTSASGSGAGAFPPPPPCVPPRPCAGRSCTARQWGVHIRPRPSFWLGWTGKSSASASCAWMPKRVEPMQRRIGSPWSSGVSLRSLTRIWRDAAMSRSGCALMQGVWGDDTVMRPRRRAPPSFCSASDTSVRCRG